MTAFLTDHPAVLGEASALLAVGTSEDLVRALIARRRKLGLSQRDVDEIAGLSNGYTSQIEMSAGPERARGARTIGWDSLRKLMHALGLMLAVVDSELSRNLAAPVDAASEDELARPEVQSFLARYGAKGGRIAARRMSADERSARARAAGLASGEARKKSRPELVSTGGL